MTRENGHKHRFPFGLTVSIAFATLVFTGLFLMLSHASVQGFSAHGRETSDFSIAMAGKASEPSPAATPFAQSAPGHVLTAAYVQGYQGTTLPASQVAPYLTWASNPSEANAPAVKAAGMKIYVYTNPNRIAPCRGCNNQLYAHVVANLPVIAKLCDGTKITVYNKKGYLTDPRVPLMAKLWTDEINREQSITATKWDAVFEDETATALYTDNGMPCNYSDSAWLAASQQETAAQGVPIIVNALNRPAAGLAMADVSNVIGAMREGCYTNPWNNRETWASGDEWITTENIEITMAQKNKTFWCYGIDPQSADQAQASRVYQDASFLLTYSLSFSLLQEAYGTPSNFPVMPESQLVPLDPLVPTPNDVAALKTPTGVYAREYAHCYYRGSLVGACAVVVNSDASSAHDYPYGTKYQHSMVLNGGGVIEGGTLATNGAAPPASMPPLSAAIAFK